jgi:hypothetical protein
MPMLSGRLMFLIVMTAWMTKPDGTRRPIQRQFHVTEIVPCSAGRCLQVHQQAMALQLGSRSRNPSSSCNRVDRRRSPQCADRSVTVRCKRRSSPMFSYKGKVPAGACPFSALSPSWTSWFALFMPSTRCDRVVPDDIGRHRDNCVVKDTLSRDEYATLRYSGCDLCGLPHIYYAEVSNIKCQG